MAPLCWAKRQKRADSFWVWYEFCWHRLWWWRGDEFGPSDCHGHTPYDLSEADAKRFAPIYNSLDHLMARAPEILGTHYDIAYPGKQLNTARNLRTLPLHDTYVDAGAHFGQFYGWERPLYFGKPRTDDDI